MNKMGSPPGGVPCNAVNQSNVEWTLKPYFTSTYVPCPVAHFRGITTTTKLRLFLEIPQMPTFASPESTASQLRFSRGKPTVVQAFAQAPGRENRRFCSLLAPNPGILVSGVGCHAGRRTSGG